MNIQSLTLKVKAVNRANKYANELSRQLIDIFTPFVGQKVIKVGGLISKYEKLLPEFPNDLPTRVYFRRSDYVLCWSIETCEQLDSFGCVYHEVTINIGEITHSVLTQIYSPCNHREDFSVAEVCEKRKIYDEAYEALQQAKNNLYPFDEY